MITALWSCKKTKNPEPGTTSATAATTAMTGTLIGTISPANAVTSISVYTADNTSLPVKRDANGKFKFTGLAARNYFFSYTVAGDYNPPVPAMLAVTAGQTLDAGTLTFSPAVAAIYGTIGPIGAASSVTATNTSTKATFSVTPDGTSGNFNFKNLAPGSYTLSVKAVAPAKAPADTTLLLTKNATISLSPIILQTPGVTGTISGTVSPAESVNYVTIANSVNRTLLYLHPDLP